MAVPATLAGQLLSGIARGDDRMRRCAAAALTEIGWDQARPVIDGVFIVATARRFQPLHDRRDIARFVAQTRSFFTPPLLAAAEELIAAELGHDVPTISLPLSVVTWLKQQTFTAIVVDLGIPASMVDRWIAEGEQIAVDLGYSPAPARPECTAKTPI